MSKVQVIKKKLKCSKSCVVNHLNDPRLAEKKVMQLPLPAFASEFKVSEKITDKNF